MSEHATIQEQLAIFDTLAPAEHQQVEHHLRTCAECRASLAAYQKMDQALHQVVDDRLRYLATQPMVKPKLTPAHAWVGAQQPQSAWFGRFNPLLKSQRLFLLELAGASVLLLFLMMLSLFFFTGWEPNQEQRLASTPTVVEPTVTATPTTPSVWASQLAVHEAPANVTTLPTLVVAEQTTGAVPSYLQHDWAVEYVAAYFKRTPMLRHNDVAPWAWGTTINDV